MANRAIRDSGGAAKAADNAAKAAWLWSCRVPVTEGCPAWLYLRRGRRFDGLIPPTLGYLPPNSKYPSAMLAAFGFCDEPEPGLIAPPAIVTGIHLTRLTPEGEKIAGDKPKIMLGPSAGLPIVLAPANDGLAIYIAEGIEDGLHVREAYGTGVWVAGSAGRMPGIAAALPDYVECVRIFAHRDNPDDGGTGIRYAQEAAKSGVISAERATDLSTCGSANGNSSRSSSSNSSAANASSLVGLSLICGKTMLGSRRMIKLRLRIIAWFQQ